MADENKTDADTYEVKRPKPRKLSNGGKIAFGGVAALLIGFAALPILSPSEKKEVQTSGVAEFQTESGASNFARIADEPETGAATPSFDLGPVEDRITEQNAALAAEIARLQAELDTSKAAATSDADKYAALLDAMEDIQATNAAAIKRLEDQMSAGRMADQSASLEAQQEAARFAELQAARQKQQEQLALRVASPSVVFDESGRSGGSNGAAQSSGSGSYVSDPTGGDRRSAADRTRDFVENGAPAVKVESAAVITSPSFTVLQGTMIRATLENAVDSSLPGTVSAMVNYPVYSFDGSRVVIPSGSRVFGKYSSDVKIGQGRILVAWSRIVTPEGQSVQIAAYGGDEQGRSGITGQVDTRFGTRFGGAALVSLIGAVPAIAVARMDDATEYERDAAENVADDLTGVTDSIISEYVKLPPIIRVEQGQQITLMVDRDLEFY